MGKMLDGKPLNDADRRNLLDVVNDDRADLTPDERNAIRQGLDDDLRGRKTFQLTRFLKIYNDTDDRLKVWVQYRTIRSDRWKWLPDDPGRSERARVVIVPPGESRMLEDNSGEVDANRVRLWARSSTGASWSRYKKRDLWLVTEMDGDQRRYRAVRTQTHTHTISAPVARAD
jgi:hypothetical protein